MAKKTIRVPFIESYYGIPGSPKAMFRDDMVKVVNEWEDAHPNPNESPYGIGMMELEIDDEETK